MEGLYILLDDITTILRKNKSTNDLTKRVKKGNIIQELKCHKEGLIEIGGQIYCSLTSFYRYIFHHYDGFEFCKLVCDDIILKTMFPEKSTSQSDKTEYAKDTSTLNLYRTLITTNILDDVAENYTPDSESDVRFLVSDYRFIPEFTENGNWAKILLFEEQFQNYCSVTERTNYETVIKKKWEFLNLCIEMKASGQVCNRMASIVCQKNSARMHAADILEGISIDISGVKHRPEILEQSVIDECNTFKQIDLNEMVVCLNCTSKCTHDHGVHVYIGWKELAETLKTQEVTTLIVSALEKKHYVNVIEVNFLSPDLLKTTENNIMRRYALRDNMEQYRVTPGKVLHTYHNVDMMPIDVSEEDLLENKYCACCYRSISENIRNPLHLDTFNLVQEWNRSVPLPIQAFMKSAFINKASVQKKSDDTKFIQTKLPALFCTWEGLLNTLNRSYIGFVQVLNTDELMVNYHNISTVFNITSLTGVTPSLRTGNRRLKKKSDPELCYYNTFHKKYPLIYTKQGYNVARENQISLRECHLVFMMDNLVHLANRTDPCPGEKPTNQVCTLPLTLKGVPADSSVVSSWHSEICDGSPDCECLKPKGLLQTDIETVLLKPTETEQMAADKLNLHSKWGILCLWQELQSFKKTAPSNEQQQYTNENMDTYDTNASISAIIEQTGEQGYIQTIEQTGEYARSPLTRAILEQAGEQVHSQTIEQTSEYAGNSSTRTILEQTGEQVHSQTIEQTGEYAGSSSTRTILEQAREQVHSQTIDQTSEYAGSSSIRKILEQPGEQVHSQTIEQTSEYAGSSSTRTILEQAGEQVHSQTIEQTGEYAGNSSTREILEQAGERVHSQTIEQTGEYVGSSSTRTILEQTGEEVYSQTIEQTGEYVGRSSTRGILEQTGEQVHSQTIEQTGEYAESVSISTVNERNVEQIYSQSDRQTRVFSGNSSINAVIEHSKDQTLSQTIEQTGSSPLFAVEEQTENLLFGTSLSMGEAIPQMSESITSIRELLETIQKYELSTGSTQLCDIYSHFQKSSTPPILCRHPPPASGKDDDIMVLKHILDDIITKADLSPGHRILFGPDFKIANNVFKLMEKNPKYQCILPEFPVLHLRKSKITNLISAYKSCGLIHIIQYMKDEDTEKDWTKLLSIENIEKATRNIWRLATGLQIAFMSVFYNTLTETEKAQLGSLADPLVPAEQIEGTFGKKYESFIHEGYQKNATFCLHYEILLHCNEIVSIAIAERLGGEDGYNLLLSAVKSSLRFSFLNGATSYAGFCVRLLLEHNKASHFHQNMKQNMFSTPHNESNVNFGLDTAREIDHRIAKKCIRPGSDLESILPKMCTVDDQQKVHVMRQKVLLKYKTEPTNEFTDSDSVAESSEKYLGKKVTSTDKQHIFRVANLILRQGGIQMQSDITVWNVYQSCPEALPDCILDRETVDIGTYLVKKFAAQTNLLGMTEKDVPSTRDLVGPKVLVSREAGQGYNNCKK